MKHCPSSYGEVIWLTMRSISVAVDPFFTDAAIQVSIEWLNRNGARLIRSAAYKWSVPLLIANFWKHIHAIWHHVFLQVQKSLDKTTPNLQCIREVEIGQNKSLEHISSSSPACEKPVVHSPLEPDEIQIHSAINYIGVSTKWEPHTCGFLALRHTPRLFPLIEKRCPPLLIFATSNHMSWHNNDIFNNYHQLNKWTNIYSKYQ